MVWLVSILSTGSVSFHVREIKDPRVHTIMSTDDVMGGSTTFTMLSCTRRFREDNPITYKALCWR